MKAIAKGAQSAWTKWERGSFSCGLMIGLVVLAVVEERVEVRLFLAGTSREARLCGDSLGEGERNQNNHSRVQVHWKSIGSFAATRLQRRGLQIGEWMIVSILGTRIVVWVSGVG